jgi:hypothetical protein
MKNLTLSLEEDTLLLARKVALEHNTTVNQLVRDYLTRLVEEHGRQTAALDRMRKHMAEGIYEVGTIDWKRDDLYER